MTDRWLNDEAFSYTGQHGTFFKAARCDFRTGVQVQMPAGLKGRPDIIMQEVSLMISHHALMIHSKLNGFPGYDSVKYDVSFY